MSLEYQLIFLFSALGAINGFLLSSYFLIIKQEKRLSDFFLGGLLLMLSVRIIKSVFLFFNPQLFQLFVQVGLSACLLIGPFLYLYVLNMTQKKHQLRKNWWWYILPFLLIIFGLSYQYPYTGKANSWGPFVSFFYKTWLVGILASAYQMRHIFSKLWQKKEKLTPEEVWLLNVFIGVTIIYLAYETASYTSYIVGALSFSFVFYLSILLRVFQRNSRAIASDPPIKYAKSSLSLSDAQAHMNLLTQHMLEEKTYLDPSLTLTKLSQQLGINSKELSQSINQMTSFNYSKYIAHLRVEEAKRLLASPDFQHYKIAAIAYESGFNSLSSFNATFKQFTNITPDKYRKQL